MKPLDAIRCPKCRNPLRPDAINGGFIPCPYCRKTVRIEVYPTLFKDNRPTGNAKHADEGEAYCSTHGHDTWPATFSCDACGRFICDLCQVTVNDQAICTNCLINKPKEDMPWDFDKKRPMHHLTAVWWLVLAAPLFFLFFGPVLALIYSIKALKQKPPFYKTTNTSEKVVAGLALTLAIVGLVFAALFWGEQVYG
jgi:hypothetical protein